MAYPHRHYMAEQDSRHSQRPRDEVIAEEASNRADRPARSNTWSLIEKLPVCVTVLRRDGIVVSANERAASMTGYDIRDMIGCAFWTDVVHPEDRPTLIRALRLAAEGTDSSVAIRFLGKGVGQRLAEVHLMAASVGSEPMIGCVALDASGRGEVEEALFQSEARYRIFLEQGPVGMVHFDASGIVTFENHQFRQIVGESPEDAWIGRSISEIQGLDTRAKALIEALLDEGDDILAEAATYRGPASAALHLQIHGSPIRHPEGRIVGGVLMVEDRTEERRREDAFQLQGRYAAAESDLRKAALAGGGEEAFLEDAARIIGESTRAGRIYLMINNAAGDCCIRRACWGRTSVEAAAPLVLMHDEVPDLQDVIARRSSMHVFGQSSDEAAGDLLRLTGARDAVWSPFFDEARLGGFVVFERDDTDTGRTASLWGVAERRLAEQMVRQFETLWSRMQAAARYHQIARTIEDCLFTYTFDEDGERRFLFLTPQIETLTGYTATQIIGCALEGGLWTDVVVYEADQRLVDGHDDALRRGREGRIAYRVKHVDGTVRWVQEQARCEVDGMGDIIVRGIMADITEQKAAEQVLTDATLQAESVARLKSAFIATMSHEIRTPMGAVNGFAELLTRELADLEEAGVSLPPQVFEFLQAVRENSKRLLTLVNDLFDLSNLEDGSIDLHGSAVSFHEIVARSANKVAAPLSRKGIDLRVELADRDPIVTGDARRLEQVMDNLLSNAVKFTHQGYVRVRTRIENGWIVAEVADSGVGIADRHLDRLFDPFMQEDSRLNRTYEGSGLGLTLVKRLLALMDGNIEAESEKGKGSLFRIRLPESPPRARQPGSGER